MRLSKVFKAKTYQEALDNCPKGYRMLEIWELVKLACENNPIIFDTEKDNWLLFWSKTKFKDIGARRLFRGNDGDWYAYWDCLAGSGDYGRVVYVKIDKKVKA